MSTLEKVNMPNKLKDQYFEVCFSGKCSQGKKKFQSDILK